MSSTVVGAHSGAGPLSLMSCVRESSPPQDVGSDFENEKNVGSKKKFWNPKKWFKRKHKVIEDGNSPTEISEPNKEAARSRSTSELSISEDTVKRRSSTSMHPGLSVSHDSVFHSPQSGSELELDNAQSTSSLSIPHPHQDLRFQSELSERLRSRRGRGDTSEDDEGLPHSPCNSPTTTEGLLEKTAIKDHPTKSHSTCSDGSLLSMGSSEMDEDSFGQQSRHSSKLSLHEKRSSETDSDLEFGPSNLSTPLNHSAAHHKVAVRPKRTHGAPRRKRPPQLSVNALPVTPEVNEDLSNRSLTPEGTIILKGIITELYSSTNQSRIHTTSETQLKCSSLPPGLAGPGAETNKLIRSCSNAGSKSQEHFSTLGEEDEDKEEKSDKSFFDRIFPRRSAKKKKNKEEKEKNITSVSVVNTQSYTKHTESAYTSKTSIVSNRQAEKRPILTARTGAAARQRVQPIDIPASPDLNARHDENTALSKLSPEKFLSAGTSPLQAELENHFRNRLSTSPLSSSPPSVTTIPTIETPPVSPVFVENFPPSTACVDQTHIKYIKQCEISRENRLEELRSKVRFPGLSALQERVLSLQDETEENSFKSLTDLPLDVVKTNKPVIKSHSFKSVKSVFDVTDKISHRDDCGDDKTGDKVSSKCEIKGSIFKASSLDSIKNLEDIKSESVKTDVNEINENFREIAEITITGPSHTAVSNVNNTKTDKVDSKIDYSQNTEREILEKDSDIYIKDQQISITKIQVKRESTQVSTNTVTVTKNAFPEFLTKPLNKIESRPTSNVVFTTTSPRIIDEQSRPKTVFNFDTDKEIPTNLPRKFSKDDVEIIDKEISEEIVEVPSKTASSLVTITSMTPQPAIRMYKKYSESQRKTSVVSESALKEKPPLKIRSTSLEIVDLSKKSPDIADVSDKSSQDSLDRLDDSLKSETSENTENIVSRRKSMVRHKTDDEPELMKVFARRSLKLKDNEMDNVSKQLETMIQASSNDSNTKSRDSDKENHVDSPPEERKKSVTVTKEIIKTKESHTEVKSVTAKEYVVKPKEPLTESKFVETTEVTLRKPANNKSFAYQRALIMNLSKPVEVVNTELKVKKQGSFSDRPKTESWLTNVKNQEIEKSDKEERITSHEIITDISPKSDFINEDFATKPKNFNQRKAEWEKRAQEALKKNVP